MFSAGRHALIADLRRENADAGAKTLVEAGFRHQPCMWSASRASVHALAEQAPSLGDVIGVIHAAGASPSRAPPATILQVDLYGTALVLEEFGNVIARQGSAVVIASQSGHPRLPHGKRGDGLLLVWRAFAGETELAPGGTKRRQHLTLF